MHEEIYISEATNALLLVSGQMDHAERNQEMRKRERSRKIGWNTSVLHSRVSCDSLPSSNAIRIQYSDPNPFSSSSLLYTQQTSPVIPVILPYRIISPSQQLQRLSTFFYLRLFSVEVRQKV